MHVASLQRSLRVLVVRSRAPAPVAVHALELVGYRAAHTWFGCWRQMRGKARSPAVHVGKVLGAASSRTWPVETGKAAMEALQRPTLAGQTQAHARQAPGHTLHRKALLERTEPGWDRIGVGRKVETAADVEVEIAGAVALAARRPNG